MPIGVCPMGFVEFPQFAISAADEDFCGGFFRLILRGEAHFDRKGDLPAIDIGR